MPAGDLVIKPETVTMDEAASLASTGMTAHAALVDVAKIEPGQRVFVNGGTAVVGALAIQVAKAKGCVVTATTSTRNVELVKSLGADVVSQMESHVQR